MKELSIRVLVYAILILGAILMDHSHNPHLSLLGALL